MSFSVRLLSGMLLCALLTATLTVSAATQTVFGPKSYSPGVLKLGEYKEQFAATATTGTLKITNGDGRDIQLQTCSGNLVQKLLCQVNNLLISAELLLTRPSSFSVEVNGTVVATQVNLPATKGMVEVATSLIKGQNSLRIKVAGSILSKIKVEVAQPVGSVNQSPIASFQMSTSQGFAPLTVSLNALASTDPDGQIVSYIWDFGDGVGGSGAVLSHVYMVPGAYSVNLTVKDNQGAVNSVSRQLLVIQNQPPTADLRLVSNGQGAAPLIVMFDASKSKDPENSGLRFFWNFGDGTEIEGASVETHEFKNSGSYSVVVKVLDANGEYAQSTVTVMVTEPVLPQAPENSAPQLSNVPNPTFEDKVSFLYSGANPIQMGVVVGKIDPKRLSVLRGVTLDETGAPLSGVSVQILNEKDFGKTLSRVDGAYDLAFNSGGAVTLEFKKNGYAPLQRRVEVRLQDYFSVDEVRLVKLDSKVTEIALNSSSPQTAQGTTQSDASGDRTGTVVFPAQVQAQLVMPDGSTKAVNDLKIRITEFTVGEDGYKKMPATLPQQTAYTYAMEISADEAIAVGANSIKFNKPVSYYVDNFLNFPVGVAVPVGSYDVKLGVWKPQLDGIVLKVLSRTQQGVAEVDLGKGRAATVEELALVGIDESELKTIASLYVNGKSLWRMATDHFSTFDLNPARDGFDIFNDGDFENADLLGKQPINPCGEPGCQIDVESKTMKETLDVPGAGISLKYSSYRVPGRKTGGVIDGQILGPNVPPGLKRIELRIDIAGRVYTNTYDPVPNTVMQYQWDGFDAYGRSPDDIANAKVRVRYVIDEQYQLVPYQPGTSSFGGSPGTGGITMPTNRMATGSADQPSQTVSGRGEIFYDRSFDIPVKATHRLDSAAIRSVANGWFIDKHHIYDPRQNAIFFGSGQNLQLSQMPKVFKTVAGGKGAGFSGDGGQARFAQLNSPSAVVTAADGSIYIADTGNNRIRKVNVDGIISTVIGNGLQGYDGDGGPAIDATLNGPRGVKVNRDGTLLIVDTGNHCIRSVDERGTISTFAGVCGRSGFTTGARKEALLNKPMDIVFNGDGNFYVSDTGNHAIRRISAIGELTTIAGNGSPGKTDDSVRAVQSQFNTPRVTDIDETGQLYIADTGNNLVRMILSTGKIKTIIGNGDTTYTNQFVFGTEYALKPSVVAVQRSGEIFVAGSNNFDGYDSKEITYMDLNGRMNPYITAPYASPSIMDYAPGGMAGLVDVQGLFANSDGSKLVADSGTHAVSIYDSVKPDRSSSGFTIASEDGSELFVFDLNGKHLKTLFGKTGTAKYTFEYDTNNFLIVITDAFGNRTQLHRDSSGRLMEIIGPYGHVSLIGFDSYGYLNSFTTPSGDQTQITNSSQGLITSFRKPKGNTSTYAYNSYGELSTEKNPQGGTQILEKRDSFTTRYRTGLGRTYEINQITDEDGYQKVLTDGNGRESIESVFGGFYGRTKINRETRNTQLIYDQRSRGISTYTDFDQVVEGGAYETREVKRSYQFPSGNYFDYILNEQITDNFANTTTRQYISSSRTDTTTSPLGVQMTTVLDMFERPVSMKVGSLEANITEYDSRGRIKILSQGERSTKFEYDVNGRLSKTIDALGRQFSFGYDQNDRVTSKTQPDGRVVYYSYDANSNLAAIKPPARDWHQMVFGLLDFMSVYNPPQNANALNATTYSYTNEREISRESRADGKGIVYDYTSGTRKLASVVTEDGSQFKRLSYNSATAEVDSITSSSGVNLNFERDGSAVKKMIYSGAVSKIVEYDYAYPYLPFMQKLGETNMTFLYDTEKKLKSVQLFYLVPSAKAISSAQVHYPYSFDIDRDQNGLVSETNFGPLKESYTYNKFGETIERVILYGGTEIFAESYIRDNLGRITEKGVRVHGESKTFNYSYDLAGRLQLVSKNGQLSREYSYDEQGNRLGDRMIYDAEDRLVQAGDVQYTYTANGELSTKLNTLNGETTRFVYDVFGSLKSVSLPGGHTVEYLNDGQDKRTMRIVDGVVVSKFLYDQAGRLFAELNPDDSVKAHFFYATQVHSPDGMVMNNKYYKFVKDQLGTIRMVVDNSNGQIVQAIDYDEFGVVISDSNPGLQPFGFAGGVYDHDTKLVRFGARDYDASVGRWTAKDPILFKAGDSNLYVYVNNDPVNYIDPTGLQQQCPWYEEWWDTAGDLTKSAFKDFKDKMDALKNYWNDRLKELKQGMDEYDRDKQPSQ